MVAGCQAGPCTLIGARLYPVEALPEEFVGVRP